MSEESPIVRKIRALLAMANDKSIGEAEALEFNRKAYELLSAHNLDLSDLTAKERSEGVVDLTIKDKNTNYWRGEIYSSLAGLYFCRMYYPFYMDTDIKGNKVQRKGIGIVGKKHNTEIVASMAEYLIKTTLRLAKNYSSYRRDVLQFEKGCGIRLAERIRAMAKVQQSPQPQLTGSSGLPALYKLEFALADDFLKTLNLRPGRATNLLMRNAAGDGARAANNVNLGSQIGNAGSSRMLR